jgi:hypothetical protein
LLAQSIVMGWREWKAVNTAERKKKHIRIGEVSDYSVTVINPSSPWSALQEANLHEGKWFLRNALKVRLALGELVPVLCVDGLGVTGGSGAHQTTKLWTILISQGSRSGPFVPKNNLSKTWSETDPIPLSPSPSGEGALRQLRPQNCDVYPESKVGKISWSCFALYPMGWVWGLPRQLCRWITWQRTCTDATQLIVVLHPNNFIIGWKCWKSKCI